MTCNQKTLFEAVAKNDLKAVQEQLKSWHFKKEWLGNNSYGISPLYLAAQDGSAEIVKLLLEAGADIDIKSSNGWYPMGIAANKCQREVLQELLQREPGFDHRCQAMNNAIEKKFPDIARDLAEASTFDKDCYTISTGNRYIHDAVKSGCAEIVAVLISAGVDIECRNHAGNAPLHLAVESKQFDLVECLLSKGAKADATDKIGRTALDLAREKNLPYIVKLLEKHLGITPPPPKTQTETSWTRLGDNKIAHISQHPEIKRTLTEIFNFTGRNRIIITENTQTKVESTTQPESFDAIEESVLRKAFDSFRQQGGEANEAFVFNYIQKSVTLKASS